MREQYFSFFKFKECTNSKTEPTTSNWQHYLDWQGDVDKTKEFVGKEWNERQVKREFRKNLDMLAKSLGQPLPMLGRRVYFVSEEEMKPKTEEERKALVREYGDHMVDGSLGDCDEYNNGRFKLRLGFKNQEEKTSKDEVMETYAHEYGHTLGLRVETLYEEMKASAFAQLFMKFYQPNVIFAGDVFLGDLTVHEKALYKVEQLVDSGITYEAIIAHLINEDFAGCNRYDYIKLLK